MPRRTGPSERQHSRSEFWNAYAGSIPLMGSLTGPVVGPLVVPDGGGVVVPPVESPVPPLSPRFDIQRQSFPPSFHASQMGRTTNRPILMAATPIVSTNPMSP